MSPGGLGGQREILEPPGRGSGTHYKVIDLMVEIMLGIFSLEGNPLFI